MTARSRVPLCGFRKRRTLVMTLQQLPVRIGTGKKSFKPNIISLTKDIIVTSVTGADSRLTLVITGA